MQQNMCEFDEFWNSSNSQLLFLMVPSWLQLIFLSLNETLSQSLYDVRREWSSGLSAGLWVGRPGFESWPGHYVVALSKPLHSPCFVFSDKTLSRRSRLLQGLG